MPEAVEGQVVETLPPVKPTRKALKGKTDSLARMPHEDPFLAIIERAITTPNFEVNKLQELLAVRERWEKNEAQKAYTVAAPTATGIVAGPVTTPVRWCWMNSCRCWPIRGCPPNGSA